jgi:hypothetical protein
MKKKLDRGSGAKTRRSVVLVFGEDEHDTKAIRHIVEGLRPDLAGTIEPRRYPLVLIKNATQEKARDNAQRIAEVARQEMAARTILAVLAHQDCDSVEPAHVTAADRIEAELHNARCPGRVIAVTPAWEIEAWWMLFPEAVGKIVKGWRDPDDWIGADVGAVRNAKERLARAVQSRPKPRSPPRDYEERDSIQVARNVVEDRLLPSFADGRRASHAMHSTPKLTRSASFEAFRSKILAIPRVDDIGRPALRAEERGSGAHRRAPVSAWRG